MKQYEKPVMDIIKIQSQEPFAAKWWYGSDKVPFTQYDVMARFSS